MGPKKCVLWIQKILFYICTLFFYVQAVYCCHCHLNPGFCREGREKKKQFSKQMHSFNKIISMPILLLCLLGILGGSTEKVMVKKLEIVEQYTNFFRFGLETFEKKLESQDLKNVISIVPQMSKQAIFSPIFHGLFRHFGKVMVLVLRFSDFLKCFQPEENFFQNFIAYF